MTGTIPPKQPVSETVATDRPQPQPPPAPSFQASAPPPYGATPDPAFRPPERAPYGEAPDPSYRAPERSPYAETPEAHPGALVHSSTLQANAESFPVLKAFQDYLEEERQRARKRMVNLSIAFMVVIVLVIGGFLSAGVMIFNHMAKGSDQVQTSLLELVRNAQQTPPAAPAPPPVAVVPDETIGKLAEENRKIREALSDQMRNANEHAASLQDTLSSQTSGLGDLQKQLAAMRDENERLQMNFAALQQDMPKISSGLDQAMGAIRRIDRNQASAHVTAVRRERATLAAAPPTVSRNVPHSTVPELHAAPPRIKHPAGYRSATIPVQVATSDDVIQWQVLIPE